jgi:hypothetical protein
MLKNGNFEHRQVMIFSTGPVEDEFVTVLGSSTEGLNDFLEDAGCDHLMLNYAHGWTAQSLEFLEKLKYPVRQLEVASQI